MFPWMSQVIPSSNQLHGHYRKSHRKSQPRPVAGGISPPRPALARQGPPQLARGLRLEAAKK